jgi:ABC-2 family transporter protein
MIWLTWRQFRIQALVAAAALAAIAMYLGYLGSRIRHDYTDVLGCQPSDCITARHAFDESHTGPLTIVSLLLIAAPALIGMFWGAPLITWELEEKTDRLVWNQSVTRTRWLATKLALLTLASVAVTGLFSLLLTWNASRYDQLMGDRFGAVNFASRNVVPLGYAAFAFVLGTVIGLIVRRTLVAMALTLTVFAAVQLIVPNVVREHLMAPVTTTVAFDEDAMSRSDFFGINDRGATIVGYTLPGTWSLTIDAQVLNADGTPYTNQQATACDKSSQAEETACTANQNLHFNYTYQPADRYWPFQWIELAAYLAVTLLLAAFGFWRIRHRSS